MAEQKSPITQALEANDGSSAPEQRASPFGNGEGGLDLSDEGLARLEQQQQPATEPTPPAEDPELEFDADAAAAFLEGRIDERGFAVEESLPPEIADAVHEWQQEGYSDEEIDAHLAGLGYGTQDGEDVYDDEFVPESPVEAISSFAEDVEAYREDLALLQQEHPALLSEPAMRAMEPILTRIADAYGPSAAADLDVLMNTYTQVGGDERFGREVEDRQTVEEIFNSRPGSGGSAFT